MRSLLRRRRKERAGIPPVFKWPKFDTERDWSQEALNCELRNAVRSGAPISQALWLVSVGADVNCRDSSHYTPLLIALSTNTASADTVAMVATLCELGADVNYASNLFHGDTPLHFAAALRMSHEIISILLKHQAHVHACNHAGRTPLHVAACCGNEAAVRMLYLGGARVNVKERYCGYSPLHLAVMGSCCNTVQALMDCGASSRQSDACGLTSADRCHSQETKRLLDSRCTFASLEHLCLHAIREAVRNSSVCFIEGFQRLTLPFTLKNKLLFNMD